MGKENHIMINKEPIYAIMMCTTIQEHIYTMKDENGKESDVKVFNGQGGFVSFISGKGACSYELEFYTPYLSIPDGMPVKGDKASSYDIMVFFKPIATRSLGIVRVARGTRMCREKCATYRFHFYEWQEEIPGWKTSSNQK